MHRSHRRLTRAGVVSSLVLLVAVPSAGANYYELLRLVPDSANTIIMIDLERLLTSPIAIREQWREKGNAEGVALHFPINAERYMLASKVDFIADFADLWDVALIETSEGVSLPYLSKIEGGYLDALEGQQIAFSPRNAFFVSFKPTIVGVSFPANRQDLGRWLRSLKRRESPQVSDYLQQGVTLAHGKDHIVVVMDLKDLLTPRIVRERLQRMESLAGRNVNLDTLTRVLTSARGVTLTLAASDKLEGKIRLDLGQSPAPIKDVAKPLFIEVLEKNGMLLPEMRDWSLLVEATAVSLQGRLSTRGLRALTDLIPFPADTVELDRARSRESQSSSGPPGSPSTPDLKVAASKKYYQYISQRLDELRKEVRDATKPKIAQKILNNAALEIDRLPILNVDEDLLAYGAGVTASLRNIRNLSKNADLDFQYRKAAIQGSSDGYGYGGFYGGGTVAGATTTIYRQETAVFQSNELAVLTMLEEKTAEIRKKMTLKYQVEF
jgi:hypothetical protein